MTTETISFVSCQNKMLIKSKYSFKWFYIYAQLGMQYILMSFLLLLWLAGWRCCCYLFDIIAQSGNSITLIPVRLTSSSNSFVMHIFSVMFWYGFISFRFQFSFALSLLLDFYFDYLLLQFHLCRQLFELLPLSPKIAFDQTSLSTTVREIQITRGMEQKLHR